MIAVSEAENFPLIVKVSSNEKKMKKQCKVFSRDEKMQILAKGDYVGTSVDLVAMLGLLVSTLNTIVSEVSEIEGSYSCCGPSFSKEHKSMETLPLEELETILSVCFRQACTTSASIDGTHLKEKALHVAACLGIDSFWASYGWIDCFKKRHKLVYKTMSGESSIVNPETVMDWKSEQLPKIIDGYQAKEIFNNDETELFYNILFSKTVT